MKLAARDRKLSGGISSWPLAAMLGCIPARPEKRAAMFVKAMTPIRALSLVLALSCIASQAEEPVRLKQSFPVGKKLTQTMKVTQKSKVKAGGTDVLTKTTQDMTIGFAVRAQEANQKKVVMTYEKATMTVELPKELGGENSSKENYMANMEGKSLTLLINEKDEVTSVEGLEAFAEGANPIARQVMDDSKIKEMMNGMFLPDRPVKVGDAWPFRQKITLPIGLGQATTEGECRLESREGDLATIVVRGTVKIEGDKLKPKNSPYVGKTVFDAKLGLPRKSELTINMDIEASIGPAGEGMKMSTEQLVETAITEVEDLK